MALVVPIYYVMKFDSGEVCEYRSAIKKELSKCVEESNCEESAVSFYTDGHPYVWVESTKQELEKILDQSCIGLQGASKPSSCKFKINKSTNSVYVVTENNIDKMSTLMHYQEWLDSNKIVAENIAKNKNA